MQTNTGTSTALTAGTHSSTRTVLTCDSLDSLTLHAPEAGDFAEYILLYTAPSLRGANSNLSTILRYVNVTPLSFRRHDERLHSVGEILCVIFGVGRVM
jgi:hypothetical protein